MKKTKWKVGDLMVFAGMRGPVHGVIIKEINKGCYRIHWFDDSSCTDEIEGDTNSRVKKAA